MTRGAGSRLEPFGVRAAWQAATLAADRSWTFRLDDAHRAEILAALDHFKAATQARGLTAQWLHGHMVPDAADFPLPTLAPLLARVRDDLEHAYGLFLLKGFPVGHPTKDLHLLHAGLCAHVGTPRPQTVFNEKVQDIRNAGQAPLIERRGSKHDRPLPFHNDPADVVSFLCIRGAQKGGESLFASSVAIHDAMLRDTPEHVAALYEDLVHSYQEYLFVRTGSNARFLPRRRTYRLPTFSVEQGHFACKYSRFYVDQAQQMPGVPPLTERQRRALDAWEAAMADERFHLRLQYEPGDVMFVNNFTCLHARTAFQDDPHDERNRRHLLRIWLSMPNSRPLSPKWRHVFFRRLEAGAIRGGVPVPEVTYG